MSSTGTQDFDPATQPKRPDATLGDLVGELTSGMSTLFRQELELAKTEARDEAKQVGAAAGMMAAAGVGGLLALMLLSWALAWLIDQALNTALSFAIVGVLWAIIAFVLLSAGRKKLSSLKTLPKTKQTIKEDVEWAKAQKS